MPPATATITTARTKVARFPSPGSLAMAMAPRPAKVSGASDIWPAYPVSGTSDKATMAMVKPLRSNRVFERVSMPEIATTTATSDTAPSIEVRHSGTRVSSRKRTTPARSRLCGRVSSAMKRTMVGMAARMPARENPNADCGNHDSSEYAR